MTASGIGRVVAVVGIVALSTAAHAGRGSGGATTQVYKCFSINGANSNRIVTLTDEFGTAETVRVGSAVLVCGPAEAAKLQTTDPNFDNIATGDHLKCYVISGSSGPSPKPTVRLTDAFNGGFDLATGAPLGEDVNVSASKYICTFADLNSLP